MNPQLLDCLMVPELSSFFYFIFSILFLGGGGGGGGGLFGNQILIEGREKFIYLRTLNN